MEFDITIIYNQKPYKRHVKRVHEGDTVERFEVFSGGTSIVLQTDFNYIKKAKLRKTPDWKIVGGEVTNGVAFALTIREIERFLSNYLSQ